MALPVGESDAAETTAFLARTSGLSAGETAGYKACINYWVTNSVFALMDVAYILATKDTTTALLNLLNTNFTGVLNGSPTFTADQGFTFLVNDGQFVDTTFVPSTAGGLYTQNAASIGSYNRTSRTVDQLYADGGAANAANTALATIAPKFGGNLIASINNGAFQYGVANANSQGQYVMSRTSSVDTFVRKNEASLDSKSSDTSVATIDRSLYIGGYHANGSDVTSLSTGDQIAAFFAGGALTATQADFIAHGFNLYMAQVGANVY